MGIITKEGSAGLLRERLEAAIYDATTIHEYKLDYLKELTEGTVDIVNPGNAFIYGMETSSIETSAAILTMVKLLEKSYPTLAKTDDDLYRHMANADYENRFGVPGTSEIRVFLPLYELEQNAVRVENRTYRRMDIPRGSRIEIAGHHFTINHTVQIRIYPNDVVKVVYVKNEEIDFDPLNSNILTHRFMKYPDSSEWIYFDLLLQQTSIYTTTYSAIKSEPFNELQELPDEYVRSMVYHLVDGRWRKINVVHNDHVYHPDQLTARLTVVESGVRVEIPPLYNYNELLGTKIKIVSYVTKANSSLDLKGYGVDDFKTFLAEPDLYEELTPHAKAFASSNYYFTSNDSLHGGRKALAFEDLKDRVLRNGVGRNFLPVTNTDLAIHLEDEGFSTLKFIDDVTGRTYIVSNELPPLSSDGKGAPVNCSSPLLHKTNQGFVDEGMYVNDKRITLPPETLYKLEDGGLSIISPTGVKELKELPKDSLAKILNDNSYLYSPLHYVLDDSREYYEVRVYRLTKPEILLQSFDWHNETTGFYVNTNEKIIEYYNGGYRISITTTSDSVTRNLDSNVIKALVSIPTKNNTLVFFEMVLERRLSDSEYVFVVDIPTRYDLDDDDWIEVIGGYSNSGENVSAKISLDSEVSICYYAEKPAGVYQPSALDDIIVAPKGKTIYPISSDTLTIRFGTRLEHLWVNNYRRVSEPRFARHNEDVPLVYDKDVFVIEPKPAVISSDGGDIPSSKCSMHYKQTGTSGETAKDVDGNIIYKHRKGDVIYEGGDPVLVEGRTSEFYLRPLMFSAKYYFSDDVDLLNEIESTVDFIEYESTRHLSRVVGMALEVTDIYYHPYVSDGMTTIQYGLGKTKIINMEQRLVVELHVENSLAKDKETLARMKLSGIATINESLKSRIVVDSDIVDALKTLYGDSVINVKLKGFDGDSQLSTIMMLEEHERLSLAKKAYVTEEGYLSVTEDVEFIPVNYALK